MNILIQEISGATAPAIIEKIENQTEETILIINSFGGSVFWGLKIYEAIRNARYPVTGLVLVQAASIAVLILQACTERFIEKKSKIVFHDAIFKKPLTNITLTDLKIREEQKENVIERITLRTGISKNQIVQFMKNEKSFSANGAFIFGLVDKVCEESTSLVA